MTQDNLSEALKQLDVIDTHEHFECYTDTFGYNLPQFLYNCSYTNTYAGYFPKKDKIIMEAVPSNEEEQFDALLRMKQEIRYTRCGNLLEDISRRLGYSLEKENFGKLKESYEKRSIDSISQKTKTIKGYICNSIGHPMYGGLEGMRNYLERETLSHAEMHKVLTVTELHSIDTKEKLHKLEKLTGNEIITLQDWEKTCENLVRQFVKKGIVGFKELYLYFRPAAVGGCDQHKAVREFDKLQKGEQAGTELMDYMMYRLYEILGGTNLPIQVHTGAVIETSETARGFLDYMKVMQAFPEQLFDLLHLNYPLLDMYIMILKSCSNAYGNLTWITSNDGEYSKRYIREAIENLPVTRTNFFGGDRHCAGEPVAAVLDQSLGLLAESFAKMTQSGILSDKEALEIAGLWLYENPCSLYGLAM